MEAITATVLSIIREASPTAIPDVDNLDKPLIDYGLDSLDLSAVFLGLEEKYGILISDEEIDDLTTANQISRYIAAKMGDP